MSYPGHNQQQQQQQYQQYPQYQQQQPQYHHHHQDFVANDIPPPPPPHTHQHHNHYQQPGMHPSQQQGSAFAHMQQDRQYGVTSQQSLHSDRQRSHSPIVPSSASIASAQHHHNQRPQPAFLPRQSHSSPSRHMSPSPPLHPGMPPLPSSAQQPPGQSHQNFPIQTQPHRNQYPEQHDSSSRWQEQDRSYSPNYNQQYPQQDDYHHHPAQDNYAHDNYAHDNYGPPARAATAAAAVGGTAAGAGVAGYAASQQSDYHQHQQQAQRSNTMPSPDGSGMYHQQQNPGWAPYQSQDYDTPYGDDDRSVAYPPYRENFRSHSSFNSQDTLSTSAAAPAITAPPSTYPQYQDHSPSPSPFRPAQNHPYPYGDSPARSAQFSRERLDNMVFVDPHSLVDDNDDGMGYAAPKRNSRISFGRSNNNSGAALPMVGLGGAAAAGGVAGAAAGGGAGAGAGAGSNAVSNRGDPSGSYGPIPGNSAMGTGFPEKSAWTTAAEEAASRKKKKTILIILGVLLLLGIIAGTVVGVLLTRKDKDGPSRGQSAQDDDGSGDLSAGSAEIKKLMSNSNLHKVFSGMAYTPFAAQYPDCLTYPPSQNNITRDMAVMSQLTNVVRLYGTDCNQTEMVLHAIDRLQIPSMKIWLGVWLGDNSTTNARQLSQMWTILDKYGTKQLKGLVIGNEVLFRKDLTATQLGTILSGVKSNLTAKGIKIPVATSDLGDNWTAQLASEVDVVMSNVHPFFGGIDVSQAAAWTWSFWQTHDVVLTANTPSKQNIISEVGWPSQGGKDCGSSPTCTDATAGSVAGVEQMNKFMGDWVCQALANGTDYFWFEAFDEPWKIRYNTPGKEWEDHWGLLDINRNLKKGVQIPSCGGKTVPS